MRPFFTMLKTEFLLSLRGMDMVIFALCLPVAMVFLLGMIYSSAPAFEGADYTFFEQSFGAISTIAVCAGGVMGLPLVLSDYRQKHILKRLKVTPVSPVLLLGVQITIYLVYALVSLLLITLAASLFFGFELRGSWPVFFGAYFLVLFFMFSIGTMVGGIAPNSKIAGVVASLLYFPMILLSGATVPYEVLPHALQKTAGILPLTQGIKLLKAASLGLPLDTNLFPILISVLTGIICLFIAALFFKWDN